MREITESRIDIGEVELSVVEWQGDGDPVLLLHATGFHSRCWNEVVKRLPGQHIYAVDLRFHGGSGAAGEVDWKLMVEDIRILVERLDLRQLVGVGHSIGGHLVARVAAALPGRFKQLLLIDPVIMSPERYAGLHEFAANLRAEDHPVTRRKNRWQDADEMYQRFRDKPPFDSWDPRVLRERVAERRLHRRDEVVPVQHLDRLNDFRAAPPGTCRGDDDPFAMTGLAEHQVLFRIGPGQRHLGDGAAELRTDRLQVIAPVRDAGERVASVVIDVLATVQLEQDDTQPSLYDRRRPRCWIGQDRNRCTRDQLQRTEKTQFQVSPPPKPPT